MGIAASVSGAVSPRGSLSPPTALSLDLPHPQAPNKAVGALPSANKPSKGTDWSSRELPVQIFGVIRHTARADEMGATWKGASWFQSEDFKRYPYDPPLSDEGLKEAGQVAERVSNFLGALPDSAKIHVVVSSPYLRCIQTAAAVCRRLGSSSVRLIVDLGLGEVYGPEIFGDLEPEWSTTSRVASSWEGKGREWSEHFPQEVSSIECINTPMGKWPQWPENLGSSRKRYAERLLAYLNRGTKARRNFLLVSHAECVGSCLAMMPSEQGGRTIESVGYGGMLLASRQAKATTPPEVEVQSPASCAALPRRSPACHLPSRSRACWGSENNDATEAAGAGVFREKDAFAAQPSMLPWQMETWNVQLGHVWREGVDHVLAMAMSALSQHGKCGGHASSVPKVQRLLLGSPTPSEAYDWETPMVNNNNSNNNNRISPSEDFAFWKPPQKSTSPLSASTPFSSELVRRGQPLLRRGCSLLSEISYETCVFGVTSSELGELRAESQGCCRPALSVAAAGRPAAAAQQRLAVPPRSPTQLKGCNSQSTLMQRRRNGAIQTP